MTGFKLRGCVLTLSLLIGPYLSAGEKADTVPALNEENINRRLKLLENFTRAEKTQTRLRQSSDPAARVHFSAALDARDAAYEALASGDLTSASLAIATGYEEMMLTLQLARDVSAQTREAQDRFEALNERVSSFGEAFQRIAVEKNDPEIFALLDQSTLSEILREARQHAEDGRYDQANEMMATAAARVEKALSAARNRETLVQELNFETPADEFNYELRRNESYEMLVRLLEKRGGASGALQMMHRLLEQNEHTRTEASRMFEQGQTREAINALEKRSEEMSRLLQMSGLAF